MIKLFLFQLVIAIFLSGCAASGDVSDSPDGRRADLEYRGGDCILIRTIRDYTPLDNRHLLIRGPARQTYFVILTRPAIDMRSGMGIGVESRDERLCPFGSDSIVFGGLTRERIPAQSISRITDEQEEALLIRFGVIEPDGTQEPEAPPEVEGAEVEELG